MSIKDMRIEAAEKAIQFAEALIAESIPIPEHNDVESYMQVRGMFHEAVQDFKTVPRANEGRFGGGRGH